MGAGPFEGLGRVGDCFHMLEIRLGAGGEVPFVECPRVAAAGRDQRAAAAERPASIASASLSRRIDATIVHSRGSRRSSSQATPSGVWAPSRTSSAPRRSSRPGRATSGSASIGWPANASAASRAPPIRTSASGTRPAPLVVGQDDGRSRSRDGELLARDLLARVAEHVGVLERDVRQAGRPARRRRSSRRAGRRARLRRRPTSTPRSANCASAAAVSASNCVAFAASAAARSARPRARTSRDRCRGVRASRSRAATCTRRRSSPSARSSAAIVRVAVDLPFVPTTCTEGKLRCGLPSASSSAVHPLEPELLGPRESDAIHSVAVNAGSGSDTRGGHKPAA